MSKLKGYLALIILVISWFALYWLTGSRTPWQSFTAGAGERGISIHLGDIPIQNYDRMGFTKAVVRYSKAEQGWVVGTERGELFLFDATGRQLWKRTLGIGKLVSLCMSNAGDIALVGEQSPEGKLYAIKTHTGDILWQHKSADYIGSDPSQRSYPSVVHIVVDKNDNVYESQIKLSDYY